jgi:hypothetical protein
MLGDLVARNSSACSDSDRMSVLASRPIVSCVWAKRIPKASGSMSGMAGVVALPMSLLTGWIQHADAPRAKPSRNEINSSPCDILHIARAARVTC